MDELKAVVGMCVFVQRWWKQVRDSSGRWYLADNALGPGDLLLLTGKTLEQATAGIRRACTYRVVPVTQTTVNAFSGRCVR